MNKRKGSLYTKEALFYLPEGKQANFWYVNGKSNFALFHPNILILLYIPLSQYIKASKSFVILCFFHSFHILYLSKICEFSLMLYYSKKIDTLSQKRCRFFQSIWSFCIIISLSGKKKSHGSTWTAAIAYYVNCSTNWNLFTH